MTREVDERFVDPTVGDGPRGGVDGSRERSAAGTMPEPPPMAGRRVILRPVYPEDYGFLYSLAVSPEIGFRWRYRGAVPAYDVFLRELWAGILVQFMVCDVATGEPVGFVVAHSADLKSGFAHVAVLMSPPAMGRGWGVEAGALFITYLFATWSFRKLYAESLAFTWGAVASGVERVFREEGCLRDHEFYQGRYWDLHIAAVYRTDWERGAIARLLARRGSRDSEGVEDR
jgi:RimJ/RimL family protein N-acetyltransferase